LETTREANRWFASLASHVMNLFVDLDEVVNQSQ
jgi:hypothetical protein